MGGGGGGGGAFESSEPRFVDDPGEGSLRLEREVNVHGGGGGGDIDTDSEIEEVLGEDSDDRIEVVEEPHMIGKRKRTAVKSYREGDISAVYSAGVLEREYETVKRKKAVNQSRLEENEVELLGAEAVFRHYKKAVGAEKGKIHMV